MYSMRYHSSDYKDNVYTNPKKPMTSFKRLWLRLRFAWAARPYMYAGVMLTLLSFATRFYSLRNPAHVCWDETHFGKHANYYIKGTYFFDVHPPLAKMAIALAGYLTGYDGNFEFKEVGQMYEKAHYMGMRIFCASLGSLIPVLVYGIMNNMGFSYEAAIMAACMVIFDNGMCTLSRFILLDQPLMFFIIASVYCYTKFYTIRERFFTQNWWLWMARTGAMLACAASCKWVGFFVIMFIGVSTIKELWDMLGQLDISLSLLAKNFMARVVCLIIWPVFLYMFFFAVHFSVLPKSGPGDGFMSSKFQTTLDGNYLHSAENPISVAFDSTITVKLSRANGGLLHSHKDLYPKEVGPVQQQVTTYFFKDVNNRWQVLRPDPNQFDPEPVFLRHNDVLRLMHVPTGRNLHSHKENAPITTKHFQVTGYGEKGSGDSNDLWRIQIDGVTANEDEVRKDKSGKFNINLLTTKFRLIHVERKCALCNQGIKLPKWGFEQGEVTCNPNPNESGTLWNIETIDDERLPKAKVSSLAPNFFQKFWEAHLVMSFVNNDLKPKEGENPSRPWHWPILYKGQHFTGWSDSNVRIMLLANPVLGYFHLLALGVFLIGWLANAALVQRGFKSPFFRKRHVLLQRCGGWIFIGYLMHFLPFFAMGRVLYYHHYFPALMFSCMLSAIVLDEVFFWVWHTATRLGVVEAKRVVSVLVGCCLAIMAVSFLYFSPLTYGMTGPVKNYKYLVWDKSWIIA